MLELNPDASITQAQFQLLAKSIAEFIKQSKKPNLPMQNHPIAEKTSGEGEINLMLFDLVIIRTRVRARLNGSTTIMKSKQPLLIGRASNLPTMI